MRRHSTVCTGGQLKPVDIWNNSKVIEQSLLTMVSPKTAIVFSCFLYFHLAVHLIIYEIMAFVDKYLASKRL